ncbi:GNAT family N-acetyltransferase [Streptomyces sp. NPDC058783]|uniref:GNAT family N-acetyltransferase n=1 Tax=unclassified Streptomyces TaxID=2593676 RepID=UPI0026F368D3|nr:GNAT family N-acetyltransferase [Streptomyces sp. HUAS CX7]WKX23644.1 GNAT family N-acetyltransferase [Streptomyces sp. HUAS CX7]
MVTVAELQGSIVGCAVVELPSPRHARLIAIAVRPELRRQGIGSALLGAALADVPQADRERPVVSAVASLTDLAATGFLLSCGFIGTRLMSSSPSGLHDQMHYQQMLCIKRIDPDTRHLIPVSADEQLAESLRPADCAATALIMLSGEPAFEITRFRQDDAVSRHSGSTAASVSISGYVLAAIVILLGFSFVSSNNYTGDVRLLLIAATVVTTISLILHASASGTRASAYEKMMMWGNTLAECGGVLPFLILLPVINTRVSENRWMTMALAVITCALIAAYERSQFSITYCVRRGVASAVLGVLTALSPVLGSALVASGMATWPWTFAIGATLAARAWICLRREAADQAVAFPS